MSWTIIAMTWNPCTWDVPTALTCIGAIASTVAIIVALCIAQTSSAEAKMLIKANSENTQKQIETLNSNNTEQIDKLVKLAQTMSSQTDEIIKLAKTINEQSLQFEKLIVLIRLISQMQIAINQYSMEKELLFEEIESEKIGEGIKKINAKAAEIKRIYDSELQKTDIDTELVYDCEKQLSELKKSFDCMQEKARILKRHCDIGDETGRFIYDLFIQSETLFNEIDRRSKNEHME
jgi:hypothetical protein